MSILDTNKTFGKSIDSQNVDQTSLPDCRFEISQAENTFKLRRLTQNSSFKINIKPFMGSDQKVKSKDLSSKPLKEYKKSLKRSSEEAVTHQEMSEAEKGEINVEYGSGTQTQESEGKTVQVRKSLRNMKRNTNYNPHQERKNKKKEIKDQDSPLLIWDDATLVPTPNFSSIQEDFKKESENFVKPSSLFSMKVNENIDLKKVEENKKLFYASFKKKGTYEEKEKFYFPTLPIKDSSQEIEKTRKDFIHDLAIVTNHNKKEIIKVSFQPGKVDIFSDIPNPFDKEARDSYYKQFKFATEYRSGYAPIDVQALQEKEFSYKNHFIKKKQSCANGNLKRVCGVSYVKKLESTQLNVDHIFPPLIPLIYQGSTGCAKLLEYQEFIKQVVDNIFEENKKACFLVALLEDQDEKTIREYLYYPEKRIHIVKGKVYLVRSIQGLWHFFKDKNFICIHLIYNNTEFIRKAELNKLDLDEINKALCKSNIQIGILCKKSLSGKKAFLKAFTEGLQFANEIEELESEDENQIPTLEELEKENKKKELKEKRENDKKEKKEKRIRERQERRERKELEKKEKKGKKEQEKLEKLENSNNNGKKNKETFLKKKHLSFFDKTKSELEKNEIFKTGLMGELFSSFDEIMQPYLKMLFLKGYDSKSINQSNLKENSFQKTFKDWEITNETHTLKETQTLQESTPKTEYETNFASETPLLFSTNGFEDCKGQVPIILEKMSKEITNLEENTKLLSQLVNDSISIEIKNKNIQEVKFQIENHVQPSETKIEEEETKMSKNDRSTQANESYKDCSLYKYMKEVKKDSNKNIITSSLRVELYTHEDSWKTASKHTRNLLYTFILFITDFLNDKIRNWTLQKKEILKNGSFETYSKTDKHIQLYEFDTQNLNMLTELIPSPTDNLNWNFNEQIKNINSSEINVFEDELLKDLTKIKFVGLDQFREIGNSQKDQPAFASPFYLINTRDSFAFDLIEKVTVVELLGRKVLKTDYYFDPTACPTNFKSFLEKFPDYHVGVTTYTNFFTHKELSQIEDKCYETERRFFDNHFLPMTGQMTCTGEKVRRTKFFFGARYMWTKQQLSEPHSIVGAGIRVDVSERPKWIKDLVENPMVAAGILEKDFVNSIAMNVYHDGKEGLAQHFDDAVRFKQPIFSLRIFSDSRLSFGSQLYGFCNGAFCIPMPRGCITVLHEESYSANGVKHCVRPCDMSGKSAALILRQMHHKVYSEAQLYDEFIDFPTWFSTLSINENAVAYSEQKRIEAEALLKSKKIEEEANK